MTFPGEETASARQCGDNIETATDTCRRARIRIRLGG
jgi:hypothetical protein